jgi:hypothetical protein
MVIIRSDRGFSRDDILTWIEKQRHTHYGIARTVRESGLTVNWLV